MSGKRKPPTPEQVAAQEAYVRLLLRLRDISDNGTPAPCEATPERWYSDDLEDREAAAHACHTCLAFAWCAEYAEAQDERHGVWGGRDRETEHKSHKKQRRAS